MDVDSPEAQSANRIEQLEQSIEDVCQASENHEVSEQELREQFLDFSTEEIKLAVESMMKKMKIQITMDEQKHTCIKLRDPSIVRKLIGLDPDEVRVYETIESVGTRGISPKFILQRSKVSKIKLDKILPSLESKQLVKAVKLQKSNQTVKSYVLFDLKLDEASAGRLTVFGNGAAFDGPLFDTVSKLCLVFLKNKMKKAGPAYRASQAAVEEILNGVLASGAVKADLNEESISAVMKMLELSGKVEKRVATEGGVEVTRYRFVYSSERPEISIPCLACPVEAMCDIGGAINPRDCPHFDAWCKKMDF